jgi:hypothetical protein
MPLTYRLGQFEFFGFKGPPEFDQAHISCLTRPGVNGMSIQDLGEWGEPFDIETWAGAATTAGATDTNKSAWENAIAICKSYATAAGQDALDMVYRSVPITGGKYKVKRVAATPQACLHGKRGGDSTEYLAIVRATWTLVPIANP